MIDTTRYPAYPLITHDPFFSIWSTTEHPAESYTQHWSGLNSSLEAQIRIDGVCYGVLSCSKSVPMTLKKRTVTATRTIYQFEEAGVRLNLTFCSPVLPDDIALMSRPLSYIIVNTEMIDGQKHGVQFFFAVNGENTVAAGSMHVQLNRYVFPGMELLAIGNAQQDHLSSTEDLSRVNWGRMFLAVPEKFNAAARLGKRGPLLQEFIEFGHLPEADDLENNLRQAPLSPELAVCKDLSNGNAFHFMLAFDDVYSIDFMNTRLKGYWTKFHASVAELFPAAESEFESVYKRCERFDQEFAEKMFKAGGENYLYLCTAAYRQAIAAHKIALGTDGSPFFFSKECGSNGSIATVDVSYPSFPLFVLMMPELAKGMLKPILIYASSGKWPYSYAPHDLGYYPLATGQTYHMADPFDCMRMPVEECGNMLLMAGALDEFQQDIELFTEFHTQFRKWAEYLLSQNWDLGDQLTTDDFAGRTAHNVNLSIKAILALGAYAKMEKKIGGDLLFAEKVRRISEEWAVACFKASDDGDHARFAFDKTGTWSQKYNLIWDRLLGLHLFPVEMSEKELAYYRKKQYIFGLPLDFRKEYTKLDWIIWSACLTADDDDFQTFLAPVCEWLSNGISRVPMSDWYETVGDGAFHCFRARSVVGGVFMKLLSDMKK